MKPIIYQLTRSGKRRACGCTDTRACLGGCRWTDSTHTHCNRCFCAACGREFLSKTGEWVYDDAGRRVCRVVARCERACRHPLPPRSRPRLLRRRETA